MNARTAPNFMEAFVPRIYPKQKPLKPERAQLGYDPDEASRLECERFAVLDEIVSDVLGSRTPARFVDDEME